MRKLLSSVSLLFLVGLSSAAFPQCQSCPERRTLSVNASGTVTAEADLAIVRVGYKLYGPDAKSAYSTASETSNAIMQALLASGVPKSAIESSSQVIQHTQPYEVQQFSMNSEERRQRLFTVAQSWTVRVPPDDAAKALNTAINAGANESGWIEWTVRDPNALEAEAAAKALHNARVVAEQMVRGTSVQLGHLISANENQTPRMWNGAMDAVSGIAGGMPMGTGMGNGTQPLAMNSRRIECTVSLYAVFAIQ